MPTMHLATALCVVGDFLLKFIWPNTPSKRPHFLRIPKGGHSMTANEIMLINTYRRQGLGYKKISVIMNLPANTVKTYIRRHPLEEGACACINCGAPITLTAHHRPRKYCSDQCRLAWWHEHQDELKRTRTERHCAYCGEPFTTHKKNQRFCSRACYADSMRREAER